MEKKGKRFSQESRTPTPDIAKKPKESWVTSTPSNVQKPPHQLSALPPGIVVERSIEEAPEQSSPQHQFHERIANLGGISLTPPRSNDGQSPLPTLPPGMSISRETQPPSGVSLQASTLPKLPPGISIESPVSRLPPGISLEKAKEEEKVDSPRVSFRDELSREEEQSSEEESRERSPRRAKATISYQEPPLNKKMRQGDNSQTLVGGKTLPRLSIQKFPQDTLRLNLPPGMMISKSVNDVPQIPSSGDVDDEDESSKEDSHPEQASDGPTKKKIALKKKRGTPRVSPDKVVPSPEDGRPAPQQERVKSPSPEPRAARGRSELARAKIRATLREDSLSDEELVGARVPYRRRLKDDDGSKSKVPVAAEVETGQSSKINRKAWQALGEEMQNPDESFNGSESLTKEVSDNHSEAKTGEDGYETVVIKPKEKKRDKRSKGARESSPATIDQLLGDDEEKPRRRTQATRHERLMEDLFDENEVPPKNVGKAKKVRGKKESTDSEEPLSQRLSGRGRSERSEGSIDEASSLPHSPERRKPMTEAESGDFEKVRNFSSPQNTF